MNNKIEEELLEKVIAITRKYDSTVPGDQFNIFKVLKIEWKEVLTHTPFLREMLNPRGSHGQGSVYLQLFAEATGITDLDYESCVINSRDIYVGGINSDKTEGGLIDILIRDKNARCIIIENKIGAPEQPNQMLRYFNYAKTNLGASSFKLVYLTLEGGRPTKWSTGSDLRENVHYRCIAYSSTVLHWLERCEAKSHALPTIRAAFTQYIDLIKYLTHQTSNDKMAKEIVETIAGNKEYVNAAILIEQNLKKVYSALIAPFRTQVEEIYAELKIEMPSIKFEFDREHKFGTEDRGFYFWLESWEVQNLCVGFTFDKEHCLDYGITKCNQSLGIQPQEMVRKIRRTFPDMSGETDDWPCYAKYEEWNRVEWVGFQNELQNGNLKAMVKNSIKEMILKLNDVL